MSACRGPAGLVHFGLQAFTLVTLCSVTDLRADEICGTSGSNGTNQLSPTQGYSIARVGTPGVSLFYRDLEFAFDTLYTGVSASQRTNTLQSWARTLDFLAGSSPLAADAQTNLQAVYNFFRREGSSWTTNPIDSLSLRVGWRTSELETSDGVPLSQYTNTDRAHVDVYLLHPLNPARFSPFRYDGRAPANVLAGAEDVTSQRAVNDTRHANSIAVVGPDPALVVDEAGAGWTQPGKVFQTTFNHEFTHDLPAEHLVGPYDELLSAGAEAVGGIFGSPAFEFPYTQEFLNVYQERTAFMAYLAFLNGDSSRTLSGIRDDLLKVWRNAQAPGTPAWTLQGLRDALSDDSCQTCRVAAYFHPGGVGMPPDVRLSTLLHNWRVAMFVNSPLAAERQLGFPTWSGFSPNASVAAWRSFDGLLSDDVFALPSIANVGAAQLTQELVLKDARSLRGGTDPQSLHMFGANYWVVRAATDVQTTNRDLSIRVTPLGFIRGTSAPVAGGRVIVSAVAYNHVDTTATDDTFLWRHPEWVSTVIAPQWTEVDSVSGELEVVVPNFGLTNKAALLVLSLADGRNQKFAGRNPPPPDAAALPYRLDLALRPPGSSLPLTSFQAQPGLVDGDPAWSPDGSALAFHSQVPAVSARTQIYRKPLAGGTLLRVAPQDTLDQFYPDWSPRGDLIAYEGWKTASVSDVWIVNSAGGVPTRLTYAPGCSAFPAFQPDGQGIAYLNFDGLSWSLRWTAVDGTGDRFVAAIGTLGSDNARPRWSADGTKIYFPLLSQSNRIAWVSKSGGSWTVLQSDPYPCYSFDLHPGSGRIVAAPQIPLPNYAAVLGESGSDITGPRLAFIDTSTTPQDVLFRFNVGSHVVAAPRYSSDGTRVAFQAHVADQDDDIFVAQVTTNHAPHLQNINDEGLEACVPFEIQLAASDADGDAVHYEVFQRPPGTILTASNIIRWTRPAVGDYWLIIRAIDSKGAVDNRVVTWHVFDGGSCGDGLTAGGGGGGLGLSALRAGSSADQLTGTASSTDTNSFLDGAVSDQWTDRCGRLDSAGAASGSLVLQTALESVVEVDQARLLVADHPSGSTAVVIDGDIAIGSLSAPGSIECRRSAPSPDAQSDPSATASYFESGSTLTLWWSPALTFDGVAVQCVRAGTRFALNEGGIEIQVPAQAGWRTVDRIYPRRRMDLLAGGIPTTTSIRLVFGTDVLVGEVRGFNRDAAAASQSLVDSLSVITSGPDDSRGALREIDGSSLSLKSGTPLRLAYSIPPPRDRAERSLFLSVRARIPGTAGAVLSSTSPASSPETPGLELPHEFELRDAEPNPFSLQTAFSVALPRTAEVLLEVFDPQGRRVRTLAEGTQPPGVHPMVWDGRDESGAPVRPGLYLVRLRAGEFSAQKRVALVP